MAKAASFDAKKSQNDANGGGDTFDQTATRAAFADPMSQAGFDAPFFSMDSTEIAASFIGGLRPGNLPAEKPLDVLPITVASSQDVSTQGAITSATQDATSVAGPTVVTSGGITIRLYFDDAGLAAPSSFRAAIVQAASVLAATITDKIDVGIQINYSGTGGISSANILGLSESYSTVRENLINHATAGDTTFDALPGGSSIQGQSNIVVAFAQMKLWGLMNPNDPNSIDGHATFARDIDPSVLGAVALHELTHALGRVNTALPDIFDLFRFTSAGTRLFDGSATTAPPAYFSIDGGNTKLVDYGQTSDPSDFLNSGVQTQHDSFNEFILDGAGQYLSAIDLQQMDALGFHVKPLISRAIEAFGETKLDQVGTFYFLDSAFDGFGPALKLNGVPVVTDDFQFSGFTPIGAEQTFNGYEVVWNEGGTGFGTNSFKVWTTDSSGNYESVQLYLAGDTALQLLETSFQQDLNGDGTIGVLSEVEIEAQGSTDLVQQGNTYYLTNSQGNGVLLRDGGLSVAPGRYGTWAPIGAEAAASGGYDVAWKDSATGHFRVWSTDAGANYTSTILDDVVGTDVRFESLETTFHQDLNGDGVIGVATVIEALGPTVLDQIGSAFYLKDFYYLDQIGGLAGSGPSLKYNGGAVFSGEFGGSVPIGAEATAGGYEVAWKDPVTGTFTVWLTDNSGNYEFTIFGGVAGTDARLVSLETIFHQDLNGDGTITIPTAIEAFGQTKLDRFGNFYYLDPVTGGPASGPLLQQNHVPVDGQADGFVPIGAEFLISAGQYQVALKAPSADQYTIWLTDSSGNYLSTVLDSVSGGDASLQMLETSFQQDLNGDGFFGAVPPMLIEGSGSTKLDQIGNNYFLDAVTGPGGSGPVLQLGSVRFDTSYQGFVPFGAERQSDGTYLVVLKVPGDDRYIVWKADSSGNYLATVRDPVSGSDPVLKSLEASFHQDLNGDGVITNPLIESFGSTKLDQIGNHYYLDRLTGAAGSGPLFQLGSAPFDTSYQRFVPIGAELQSDGNYLVALKVPDDDKYIVWKANSSGNYFATVLDPVSGNDASLQSLETSFHQDLNGDGAIGTPPTVAVESSGSTRLDRFGNYYYLDPATGANESGPLLQWYHVPVDRQFDGFAPIGAERMNDGSYLVALKASGADQYMIWNTDSSGNYVSTVLDPLSGSGVMSGSNIFLQLQEISFQQDLNSDFMIGPAILSPGLAAGGDVHGEVTLANLIAGSSIMASSGGNSSAGTINSCFSQLVQAMASYSAAGSATSLMQGINDPGLQNPMTIASHQ